MHRTNSLPEAFTRMLLTEMLVRQMEKYESLRKMLQCHLTSWLGSFVESDSFRIVSGVSPETIQKLCLFTKFPHQKIR